MTFYVEEEVALFPTITAAERAESAPVSPTIKNTEGEKRFSPTEIGRQVMEAVLAAERCPYEAQVSLLLTDDAGIGHYNQEFRGIDGPTDVLSFPNLTFVRAADFGVAETGDFYFDPESGELLLGEIIISVEKLYRQAADYGHSLKREFAFLVAHSMLHLCGYDHLVPEEAAAMEGRQEQILSGLGIGRGGQHNGITGGRYE